MRSLLLPLLLLSGNFAFGQVNSDAIWYFGRRYGLNYSSGSPATLNNSAIGNASNFSTSTVSDFDGNLLMYGTGEFLIGSDHNTAPNGTGLDGAGVYDQSVLIAPVVGEPSLYWMFTIDGVRDAANLDGITAYLLDSRANGCRGDVIGTFPIAPSVVGEGKVIAVPHANGQDYWVIFKLEDRHQYITMQVTNSGFLPATVFDFGDQLNNNPTYNGGVLRASPDHSKLLNTTFHYRNSSARLESAAEVYDFDNATGVLSNKLTIVNDSSDMIYYGADFSENGQYVYMIEESLTGPLASSPNSTTRLSRVDITLPNPASSKTTLLTKPTTAFSFHSRTHFKRDKDGVILFYDRTQPDNILSAITNANAASPIILTNYITFPAFSGDLGGGLPNQFDYYSALNLNPLEIGNDTLIGLPGTANLGQSPAMNSFTYSWSPTTAVADPTAAITTASPTTTTAYTCTISNGCQTYTRSLVVTVDATLPVEILGFTGEAVPAGNALAWDVAREEALSHYTLERSPDRAQFTAVAEVPATGRTRYAHTDPLQEAGTWYYRLVAVDLDGSQEYGPIVEIARTENVAAPNLTAYPNPTVDRFTVEVPAAFADGQLEVFDGSGRRVALHLLENATTAEVFSADWPTGVYRVVLRAGSNQSLAGTVVKR